MSASFKTTGERGFLRTLLPRLTAAGKGRFLLPPGDDTAVLKRPAKPVLTIDGLAEGTHFRLSWARRLKNDFKLSLGRALGWKLLGSSLSDLAATGRTEGRWALVYMGAPSALPVSFAMDLFRGLHESARTYNCTLTGGDTVRASSLSLAAAVGGELKGRYLSRSGARVGDLIAVSGPVGDAAAGLEVLEGRLKLSKPAAAYFVWRFFAHQPLFKEGRLLASEKGVTSLMDLSDALGESLELLCAASHAGAAVDLTGIPVSDMFARCFEKSPRLLSAGEDYGLLFTLSPSAVQRLARRMTFSVIGRIMPARYGLRYAWRGRPIKAPRHFRHFK